MLHDGPADSDTTLILAHGAGAGMDSLVTGFELYVLNSLTCSNGGERVNFADPIAFRC